MIFVRALLGFGALLVVFNGYIKAQTDYGLILNKNATYLVIFCTMAIWGGVIWAYSRFIIHKKSFILTWWKGLLYIVISFFIVANITLYHSDLYTIPENHSMVILENDTIEIIEPGETMPTEARVLYKGGSIISHGSKWKAELSTISDQDKLFRPSFKTAQYNLWPKFIGLMGVFFGLGLFFYGIGEKILQVTWKRKQKYTAEQFFLALGLGLLIMMFVLYGLAVMKWLNPWGTGMVLAGILLVVSPQIYHGLRHFLQSKISIKWKEVGWGYPALLAMTIVLMADAINVFRPYPIGWDDAHVYLNFPNIMAQSGGLVGGFGLLSGLPGYTVITSLGFLFFDNAMVALFINQMAGFLALGALFFFLRKIASLESALIGVAWMACLPMVWFMMGVDLKVDLALLFFNILVLWVGGRYWALKDKPKQRRPFLILLGLFLGAGFIIKPTAILLIFVALAALAFNEWKWKGVLFVGGISIVILQLMDQIYIWVEEASMWKEQVFSVMSGLIAILVVLHGLMKREITIKKLKPMLTISGIIACIVAPYIMHNAWATRSLSPHDLLYGRQDKISLYEPIELDREKCDWEGGKFHVGDISNYIPPSEGAKLLAQIPWFVATSSARENSIIQDISFAFGGLLLWLLLDWRVIPNKKKFPKYLLAGLWGMYSFLWLISAKGIPWYGIAWFPLALIFYVAWWDKRRWILIVPLIAIFMGTAMSVTNMIQRRSGGLLYAAGGLTKVNYENQLYGNKDLVDTFINGPGGIERNIIMGGNSFMKFIIKNNRKRIINDPFLQYFDCAYNERNNALTLLRLQKLNVGFLIVNHTLDVGSQPYFPDFVSFANDKLELLMQGPSLTIYRVP